MMAKDVVKKTVTFVKGHKDAIIRGAAIATIVIGVVDKVSTEIRHDKNWIRKDERESMLRRFDCMAAQGYAEFKDPDKEWDKVITAKEAHDAYLKKNCWFEYENDYE